MQFEDFIAIAEVFVIELNLRKYCVAIMWNYLNEYITLFEMKLTKSVEMKYKPNVLKCPNQRHKYCLICSMRLSHTIHPLDSQISNPKD